MNALKSRSGSANQKYAAQTSTHPDQGGGHEDGQEGNGAEQDLVGQGFQLLADLAADVGHDGLSSLRFARGVEGFRGRDLYVPAVWSCDCVTFPGIRQNKAISGQASGNRKVLTIP
jgi:hypothetical protein